VRSRPGAAGPRPSSPSDSCPASPFPGRDRNIVPHPAPPPAAEGGGAGGGCGAGLVPPGRGPPHRRSAPQPRHLEVGTKTLLRIRDPDPE
jgi:hypothetical protein